MLHDEWNLTDERLPVRTKSKVVIIRHNGKLYRATIVDEIEVVDARTIIERIDFHIIIVLAVFLLFAAKALGLF